MNHPPRPYQLDAIAAVESHLSRGAASVCLVLPTGGGKTLSGAEMMRPALTSFLVVAHRHELLTQLRNTFQERGLWGGRFESIQSLAASGDRPQVRRVFIDECHHSIGTPQWSAVAQHYRAAGVPIIGATATPIRQDGAAFGELFSAMVVAASIRQLTALGYLVPARVFAPDGPRRQMAQKPESEYVRRSPGSRAVVFCRDVKHASDVARTFAAAGWDAMSVEGRMRSDARADAFRGFATGALSVLCNVALVVEGVDVPACETVIHASGCGSVASWLQKNGRALRPAAGKTHATIIDLLGAVYAHGMPDAERTFSLDGEAIRTRDLGPEVAIRQCPVCGMVAEVRQYEAGSCPHCHAPRKARPDPRVVRAHIAEVRAGHVEAKRVEALAGWVRECVVGGRKARLAKGWSQDRADRTGMLQAGHRFKAAYGTVPTPSQFGAAVRMVRAQSEGRGRQLELLGGGE